MTMLPANVDSLRKIVAESQAYKFRFAPEDGKTSSALVDTFTAGAIMTCYNAGNDRTKQTIEELIQTKKGFMRISNACFSVIK
jgi:hypothetical protein